MSGRRARINCCLKCSDGTTYSSGKIVEEGPEGFNASIEAELEEETGNVTLLPSESKKEKTSSDTKTKKTSTSDENPTEKGSNTKKTTKKKTVKKKTAKK